MLFVIGMLYKLNIDFSGIFPGIYWRGGCGQINPGIYPSRGGELRALHLYQRS